MLKRFFSCKSTKTGLFGISLLLLPALFAPFIANGRPLAVWGGGGISFPFIRTFFAPDSPERTVEQLFNWLLLLIPVALALRLPRLRPVWKRLILAVAALLLLLPFFLVRPVMERADWRSLPSGTHAVRAPIAYGPFESVSAPYLPPCRAHWLGTDGIGRDVAARMLYGARNSLAVGVVSALLALVIGTAAGLAAGYFRGWFDLVIMRMIEILLCFPTFLLLLIVMSMLRDRRFEQSAAVVTGVLALTGWLGTAFLARGETLKQSPLPYIRSCEAAGMPVHRILFVHLLPNIIAPVLTSLPFCIAGAMLAESGLSFLGFGVQPPAASWGGILREACDDPLGYWHLTMFPGLALFIAVLSFNLTGEGARRSVSGPDC